jgi:hypothetical protein
VSEEEDGIAGGGRAREREWSCELV